MEKVNIPHVPVAEGFMNIYASPSISVTNITLHTYVEGNQREYEPNQ